jgi:hypothetical protein
LRQPLCGRADCGNPALPPPKGCEQCLGWARKGPLVVLGKVQVRVRETPVDAPGGPRRPALMDVSEKGWLVTQPCYS